MSKRTSVQRAVASCYSDLFRGAIGMLDGSVRGSMDREEMKAAKNEPWCADLTRPQLA